MAETICGITEANYLPASFNGVPFQAVEISSEHGRRGAEGEFPFGESTAYADLGRRIRTYSLRGRIQQDGFIGLTNALIAACELPGPGVLVHPTRGVINAACRSLRVTDNLEEGLGITEVDLDFVEGNAWPNGLSLVGSLLGLLLGGVVDAARASFRSRYQPAAGQRIFQDRVTGAAQSSIGVIATEYERATASSTDVKVNRILSDLRLAESDATLLVDPVATDRAITLGMNALARQVSGDAKFQTFRRIVNANAKVSTIPDPIAEDSEDAVYTLSRVVGGAYMAQAGVERTYTNLGDALAALDMVTAILEQEAQSAYATCDNHLFAAIKQFLLDFSTVLYNTAYNLPALIQYNFNGSVHPLVAAYSIFNDAKRHREIELGNIVNSNGRVGPVVTANGLTG